MYEYTQDDTLNDIGKLEDYMNDIISKDETTMSFFIFLYDFQLYRKLYGELSNTY